MDSFQVYMPNNINELIETLKKTTEKSKLLAGGTDLVISLHEGKIEPDLIIDLSGVKELNNIKEEDNSIFIGAAVAFSQISKSEFIKKHALCLVEAAAGVGSPQIRNRGTIGGNIANASPAGDSLPVLIALNAQVRIVNSQGEIQELPIEQVLVGVGKNSLKHDQAILGVGFSRMSSNRVSTFVKIGNRSTVTIARLSLAVVADYDVDNRIIKKANVALGAVGKTVLRAPRIEKLLENREVTDELREEFIDELSVEIENAIPGRYSLPYKKEGIKGAAYQVFHNLFYEC